jgi:hypothetical protein
MSTEIISRDKDVITIQVKINLAGSMLDAEETVQDAVNSLGKSATAEKLQSFDTDGSPIVLGAEKYTARSKDNKKYQTPYGEVNIERYVYQSSKGGKIYCPLESAARIIETATPKFSKIISNKYARMSAGESVEDMEENHGRKIAQSFVQNISDAVGSIAIAKEEKWSYEIPDIKAAIKTISISLDGANILMRKEGYRIAMVGAISLYDRRGDRQHSIYIASDPEYGKATFTKKLEDEIARIKLIYPKALYVGIADGAKDNWTFLKKHTDNQILDFYHASEYLADAASGIYNKKSQAEEKEIWLEQACHSLKHKLGSASRLLSELISALALKIPKHHKEKIQAAVTYFTNNKHMMQYHKHVKENLPIGSGVTEAACKSIIKERLCGSGMQWKKRGARIVLSLRPLVKTKKRWGQFWDKISQFGVPHLNAV